MTETLPELRRAVEADQQPRSRPVLGLWLVRPLLAGRHEPALPVPTPKMPYVSIDIETTGLDPESCQILEIGAVWDDWTRAHRRFANASTAMWSTSEIVGHALCLGPECGHSPQAPIPRTSGDNFLRPGPKWPATWPPGFKRCGWDGQTALTPAGKNFASFDRQFLKRLPRFEQVVKLSHRTLGPSVVLLAGE